MSFGTFLEEEHLPHSYAATIADHWRPLAAYIGKKHRERQRPLVVGVNGAQGSGKSTFARAIGRLLQLECNIPNAVLSLDDFYLTRAARRLLASRVHPLLATRGVPGTHDVRLGIETLESLVGGKRTRVPRFDKGRDERQPVHEWDEISSRPEVVIFEGWCLGVPPQSAAELTQPVNELEREQDADGRWRTFVNEALTHEYPPLFEGIDLLISLQIPSYSKVLEWRQLQEQKLEAQLIAGSRPMGQAELELFVMHFERLTRHMLALMPSTADILVELGDKHEVTRISRKRGNLT